MPLMKPFNDTRFWYLALIGQERNLCSQASTKITAVEKIQGK